MKKTKEIYCSVLNQVTKVFQQIGKPSNSKWNTDWKIKYQSIDENWPYVWKKQRSLGITTQGFNG